MCLMAAVSYMEAASSSGIIEHDMGLIKRRLSRVSADPLQGNTQTITQEAPGDGLMAASYMAAASSCHIAHDVQVDLLKNAVVAPLQGNTQIITLKKPGGGLVEFSHFSIGSGNVVRCVAEEDCDPFKRTLVLSFSDNRITLGGNLCINSRLTVGLRASGTAYIDCQGGGFNDGRSGEFVLLGPANSNGFKRPTDRKKIKDFFDRRKIS